MKTAEATIVLIGDSHATHWFPALEPAAERRSMRLLVRTKHACSAVAMPLFNTAFGRAYHECDTWRAALMKELAEVHPEARVVASSSYYTPAELRAVGYDDPKRLAALRQRTLAATRSFSNVADNVVLITDTPRYPVAPVECLPRTAEPERCGSPAGTALRHTFPWLEPDDVLPSNVRVISLNDIICPGDPCLPFDRLGITHMDAHHLASSFARRLSPILEQRTFQSTPPDTPQHA